MRLSKFLKPGGLAALLAIVCAVPAAASINYTCDGSVNTNLGLSCVTINDTLNSVYGSAFTNASASIYLNTMASGLGASTHNLDAVTLAQYELAMTTDDPGNSAVLPALPGTQSVAVTNSIAYALPSLLVVLGGTATLGGVDSSSTTSHIVGCNNPGTGTCYDGIVWVNSNQPLFFRDSNPQTSGQYDFYSVVEHETDEVLGTASCLGTGTSNQTANQCDSENGTLPGTFRSAADLFRYSGVGGGLSFGDTTNAFLSVDGGNTTLQQYNNSPNGEDFGDFNTICVNVQDAFGCNSVPSATQHDISTPEISLLDAEGFQDVVPEPATYILVGSALLGAGILRRRKKS